MTVSSVIDLSIIIPFYKLTRKLINEEGLIFE